MPLPLGRFSVHCSQITGERIYSQCMAVALGHVAQLHGGVWGSHNRSSLFFWTHGVTDGRGRLSAPFSLPDDISCPEAGFCGPQMSLQILSLASQFLHLSSRHNNAWLQRANELIYAEDLLQCLAYTIDQRGSD